MTNENYALKQANAQLDSIRDMVDALEVDYDRLEELQNARDGQSSIISGTHRPADLVPAFLAELAERDKEAADEFYNQLGDDPFNDVDHRYWSSDDAFDLVGALIDALNNVAPDCLYFGAHPDDGSDFGFWMPEDTVSELEELEEDANGCNSLEEAEQCIHEDALSVEVRSDWVTPGGELEAVEYRIVLCTGGPHVEIRGDLGRYGNPENADLYYNDWFEGLKRRGVNSDGEQTLLTYARNFYFGQ